MECSILFQVYIIKYLFHTSTIIYELPYPSLHNVTQDTCLCRPHEMISLHWYGSTLFVHHHQDDIVRLKVGNRDHIRGKYATNNSKQLYQSTKQHVMQHILNHTTRKHNSTTQNIRTPPLQHIKSLNQTHNINQQSTTISNTIVNPIT